MAWSDDGVWYPDDDDVEDRRRQVEDANEAVKRALEEFKKQPWYITAYARIRFAIYWATYWIRLQIGAHLVYRFGCDENKTFRRLGL